MMTNKFRINHFNNNFVVSELNILYNFYMTAKSSHGIL